jgi:hypothetical protein
MRERYHRLRPGAGEGVGWRGAACRGVLGARVVAVLLWDKTKQGVSRGAPFRGEVDRGEEED